MKRLRILWPAVVLTAVLPLGGCATKKYVRGEVGASEGRTGEQIDEVASDVEQNQTRLDEQQAQIGELSTTAREALERAIAAGKLAEGRFLYETVLTDDKVRFGFDESTLSDEALDALDAFAVEIKAANENVFVEIQGHTDSIGNEDYNLRLGERRAEAVRRYLNLQHGFALHRMSAISYGESEPIADNGTREGRAQNRRVALVVLK
ncbi:MAG: OmpA family protein [Thermoanaerobaculia bacterium]|nr:OmpA family protein [Thermoanaerobaculia bacterium]